MQATAQVLEQLFADSRRVTDASGLIDQAVARLSALPTVSNVAILIHQTQADATGGQAGDVTGQA